MDRRTLLQTLVSLAAGSLVGCEPFPPISRPIGKVSRPIVDAHAHIFNGSDLPAVRFIKIVFLKHYRQDKSRALLDIEDPDIFDGLIEVLVSLLGKHRAPSATDELAELDKKVSPSRIGQVRDASYVAVSETVSDYLSVQKNAAPSFDDRSVAKERIRRAIYKAGTGDASPPIAPYSAEEESAIALKAVRSNTDIGRYLRWFALFTRYRYSLLEELAQTHEAQGYRPALITPALIDYDKWLGEDVTESPLPEQVTVMTRLSASTIGPPMHAFIGFDPLRELYYRRLSPKAHFSPLDLVKRGLDEAGCIGVKLYPPMGFKPANNQTLDPTGFPKKVISDLGSHVGRDLDRILDELWAVCAQSGAAVLAHAGSSNGAGQDYEKRADPAYWLPVFKNWPSVSICLAHFGAFDSTSATAISDVFPQASWEWTFGGFIKGNPNAGVFADISYLSEIHNKSDEVLCTYAERFVQYLQLHDPECRHLVFGTDWTMMGLEPDFESYTSRVHQFFHDRCGFDEAELNRLFYENALRFLGLEIGHPNLARIQAFYWKHKLPMERLPTLGHSAAGAKHN